MAVSGPRISDTASATLRTASMSSPESISSSNNTLGRNTAAWNTSEVFVSPPDSPPFTDRSKNSSTPNRCASSAIRARASSPSIPRASAASSKNTDSSRPGTSTGY